MDKLILNIFKDQTALKHMSWLQIILALVAFIVCYLVEGLIIHPTGSALIGREHFEIGRASCRERV